MTLHGWALFCGMETALSLRPGPSVLVVISLALRRGQAAGMLATSGVLAANAVYFALSALGLGALHELSAEAFLAIKWLGAAYLVYLGARTIVRSFRSGAAVADASAPLSRRRSFWQGFVSQGANPGLLLYFGAVLPQFVNTGEPLAPQIAVLASSSFVIEFAVLSGYAALAHRAGRRAGPNVRVALDRVGGGLLIAAGAGLASLRRD